MGVPCEHRGCTDRIESLYPSYTQGQASKHRLCGFDSYLPYLLPSENPTKRKEIRLMLKAIAIGIVTYITYPIVVEQGLYPDGIPFAMLYGAGVVGLFAFTTK